MQIAGKTALVTGGTAGIGLEITRQLMARGARVVVVGRSPGRLDAFAGSGAPAFLQADLSRAEDQDAVLDEIPRRWPELSILVNNAGTQVAMTPVGIGDEGLRDAFRTEIDLNLTAPAVLALGLMPVLARQPEAAIVNISSGLALAPKRDAPVYCATKAGLSVFSQVLSYRCADAAPQIRVSDIIMDHVETEMTRDAPGKKMSAADAAAAVVRGIEQGAPKVWVGRTATLRLIHRLSPALAGRILRNA